MKQIPQFMIIYKCAVCGLDSGYTELDVDVCRYCDEPTELTMVSKKELTPEVLEQRIKETSGNMFNNLLSAFENMTDADKAKFGDVDLEKEMLLLLEKTRKLKDEMAKLKLKDGNKEADAS